MTFQSRASHSNPRSLPRFCSQEGATSICADAVWRGHPCEGPAREKLRSLAVALPGSSVVGSCGKYATRGRSRERSDWSADLEPLPPDVAIHARFHVGKDKDTLPCHDLCDQINRCYECMTANPLACSTIMK
jgi:hypothetical protein